MSELSDLHLKGDSEKRFSEKFEKWKTEKLSPFCQKKCTETCCDLREVSIYLYLDELQRIIGNWNKRLPNYIVDRDPSETGGRQVYCYKQPDFCEQFDEKNKTCKIYEQRPLACKSYPFGYSSERNVPLPHIAIAKGCSLGPKTEEFKDLQNIASEFGIEIVHRDRFRYES
jgi:Fe-S-cluster containining protein